jgi:hypothetical protein
MVHKIVLSGKLCVTWSLVLCVCFVDYCLSFCPFSFGHCVVCSSSIYGYTAIFWCITNCNQMKCNKIFLNFNVIFLFHMVGGLFCLFCLIIHTMVHKIVLSGKLLRLSQHGTKSCRYISVYVIRQNKQNNPPTIWNRKITLKFKNILLPTLTWSVWYHLNTCFFLNDGYY